MDNTKRLKTIGITQKNRDVAYELELFRQETGIESDVKALRILLKIAREYKTLKTAAISSKRKKEWFDAMNKTVF